MQEAGRKGRSTAALEGQPSRAGTELSTARPKQGQEVKGQDQAAGVGQVGEFQRRL